MYNYKVTRLLVGVMFLFLVTFFVSLSIADAPVLFDYGYDNDEVPDNSINSIEGSYFEGISGAEFGIVISTNVNVRVSPDTRQKSLFQLHNGDMVRIVEQVDDNWYAIDIMSYNKSNEVGYIRSSFVVPSPRYLSINANVNTYATPWYTKSDVTYSPYDGFIIIAETNEFYCVQGIEGKAGSVFFNKYELGDREFEYDFNPSCRRIYENSWIILTKYTTMYATPWHLDIKNGEKTQDTIMKVLSEDNDYYCVQLNSGGGSAFVKKSDVGYYADGDAYYVRRDTKIKDAKTGEEIGVVEKGEIIIIDRLSKNRSDAYFYYEDDQYAKISLKNLNHILN